MPFDSVVSIGGQSLLDGVWRILQPALQSLGNPLPVTLPGMTNAWVRVRAITPALPSSSASLTLQVDVEVLGDLLLTASVKAGVVSLTLPDANITIPLAEKAGDLNLPTTPITIRAPEMTGTLPLPGGDVAVTLSPVPATGSISLPTGGTFDLPVLTGLLSYIPGTGDLSDVGLPLPSVVPLTLNLTPRAPARVPVTVPLTVSPTIDQASAFGLLLRLGIPTVSLPTLPAPGELAAAIVGGLEKLLKQLGVALPEELPAVDPFRGKGPTSAEITATADAIVASAKTVVQDALKGALAGLTARTGRLIFPAPGAGATCETALLPTAAAAQLLLAPGGPILQLGFFRTGVSAAPFAWPASAPTAEVQITIDNAFLLRLLCCLIEKLPSFAFPFPAATATTDVEGATTDFNGVPYRACCNFGGATANIGAVALNGALSVCIAGSGGSPKTISLVGRFQQGAPNPSLPLATIDVSFTLPLTFDLDDVASLANLRVVGSPRIAVSVGLNPWLVTGILSLAALSAFPFGALAGPVLAGIILAVLFAACAMASMLLNNAVRTLLSAASLVRSPVSVPPGVFEAFGKLVPATIEIDDLTANGVLATPTAPWGLFSLEPPAPADTLERPPLPTDRPTTTPTRPITPLD